MLVWFNVEFYEEDILSQAWIHGDNLMPKPRLCHGIIVYIELKVMSESGAWCGHRQILAILVG